MLSTSRKDVLSAENFNSGIHLFDCACVRSYVGRTTQRLGERIAQHVPDDVTQLAINPGVAPIRRKPGRPKKSAGVTRSAIPVSTQTSRSSSRGRVNVEPLQAAQMDGSSSGSALVTAA